MKKGKFGLHELVVELLLLGALQRLALLLVQELLALLHLLLAEFDRASLLLLAISPLALLLGQQALASLALRDLGNPAVTLGRDRQLALLGLELPRVARDLRELRRRDGIHVVGELRDVREAIIVLRERLVRHEAKEREGEARVR